MLEDFDDFVEASMAEWRLPGLALAVIKERETILMKGYGVRDVDSRLPVTANTQFMLRSITTSFKAAELDPLARRPFHNANSGSPPELGAESRSS